MWKIINSGPEDAQVLMDKDKSLLESCKEPTLHLYRFKNPSLTYGLLMKLEEHIDLEALKSLGIEAGLRPTGGGALFHLWDLAFSCIIPLNYIPHIKTNLDRYYMINKLASEAASLFLNQKPLSFLEKTPEQELGERFCMAKPTIFDVMMEDKKMIGAAQRVTRHALLHQGTISLCPPDCELLEKVLVDKRLVQKMQEQSFYLSDFDYRQKDQLNALQTALESALVEIFNQNFNKLFAPMLNPV